MRRLHTAAKMLEMEIKNSSFIISNRSYHGIPAAGAPIDFLGEGKLTAIMSLSGFSFFFRAVHFRFQTREGRSLKIVLDAV